MNKQEILEYGLIVFNNETDKFERWLEKKNGYLSFPPKKLVDSECGRIHLKNILERIEYGIYS